MTPREKALTHLLTTSSKGEAFLRLAVRALASGLGWPLAGIGQLKEGSDKDQEIEPLLTWCEGRFEDFPSYPLRDTPCGATYQPETPTQIFCSDQAGLETDLTLATSVASFRGMRLQPTMNEFRGHVWAASYDEVEDSTADRAFFAAVHERIVRELNSLRQTGPVFYRAELDELLSRYAEPVLIMHTDGRLVGGNASARELLAIGEESIEGLSLQDFHHGRALGLGDEYIERIVGHGISRFELLLQARDGRDFPAEMLALLIDSDGEVLIQIILRDISRRRREQESQQQYLTMLSVTREMMALVDSSYHFLAVNEAYVRVFGKPREEIVDRSVADLHGPELFAEYFRPSLDLALRGKAVTQETWIPIDGTPQFVVGRYYPVFRVDGSVEAVVAVHRGNTREQKLQEALLAIATSREVNQGDVRSAIRLTTQLVAEAFQIDCAEAWILPRHQSRLLCTSRYHRDQGTHSEGERLTTKQTQDLVAALDSHQTISHHDLFTGSRANEEEATLETGIRVLGRLVGTFRLRHSDTAKDWRDSDRALFAEIAQQVAQALLNRERRDLENQLEQSKRRESLGVMAGGIAHDFNNILVSILGGAELAALDLEPEHPARQEVDLIAKAALRAADLCHQMLAYAGRAAFQRSVIDLKKELYLTEQVIRGRLSHRVQIVNEAIHEVPPIKVDTAQIHQVITNLLVNAADAYGDQAGVIRLKTGIVNGTELRNMALTIVPPTLDQAFVYLEVIDQGEGMSERVQAQMFDPFFTTKSSGRGLGLAAVLGIVQAHEGGISIASRVGKGTSMRVFLPTTTEPLQIAAEPLKPAPEPQEGARVLVVDDEEGVRKVASGILERSGFEVKVAASGFDAVDLVRNGLGDIDMVLLDLKMPGIDGVETLRRLRELRPDLPAVLSSGFAEEEVLDRLGQTHSCRFLKKPYRANDLLDAVRSCYSPTGTDVEIV